jgi:hypothetical protein
MQERFISKDVPSDERECTSLHGHNASREGMSCLGSWLFHERADELYREGHDRCLKQGRHPQACTWALHLCVVVERWGSHRSVRSITFGRKGVDDYGNNACLLPSQPSVLSDAIYRKGRRFLPAVSAFRRDKDRKRTAGFFVQMGAAFPRIAQSAVAHGGLKQKKAPTTRGWKVWCNTEDVRLNLGPRQSGKRKF